MLYGLGSILEKFYVQPLAKAMFFDAWDQGVTSFEQAVAIAKRLVFFNLSAIKDAMPLWTAIGFKLDETSPADSSGGRDMFKPVFDSAGRLAVASQPTEVPL
jgi:hypothetical protein